MKTAGFALVGMLFVQACTPPVPASNAGPGFNDYANYELERARREVAVTGSGAPLAAPAPVQTNAIGAGDLAAAGIGSQAALGAPLSALSPEAQSATAPSTPSLAQTGTVGNAQNIAAVPARTDAQQAAALRRAQTFTVPPPPTDARVNIIGYALNAPNVKGQEWYSRSLFSGQGRFERNCLKYASADAAQIDFLAAGGPERDRKGIDPDGDGFACGWDPAPFLSVAGR